MLLSKVKLVISCAVLLTATLFAQNLTTVTASNIKKGGAPLASGTICFQATDDGDNPISFRVGGGGQVVNSPYCASILAGAIVGTFQVANPLNTAPAFISYRVTIKNNVGTQLLRDAGVQFITPTFNFDNYVPSANTSLGTSTNFFSFGTGVLSNYLDVAAIANPGPPQVGFSRWYFDVATNQETCLTSAGTSCVGTSSGGGSSPTFVDNEIPSGTIDGVNSTFTLVQIPNPAASLLLELNGQVQLAGGVDYTLTSQTITFVGGAVPGSGDQLRAWYRLSNGSTNFVDFETPTGTIDGVNLAFTLAHSPTPTSDLLVIVNGQILLGGGVDYTISGAAITFTSGAQPQPTDWLRVSYRW